VWRLSGGRTGATHDPVSMATEDLPFKAKQRDRDGNRIERLIANGWSYPPGGTGACRVGRECAAGVATPGCVLGERTGAARRSVAGSQAPAG
jgi:hypothetical protein